LEIHPEENKCLFFKKRIKLEKEEVEQAAWQKTLTAVDGDIRSGVVGGGR